MLICAVAILATLGADALFYPVQNTDAAKERENINSIQNNEDLYPETQARTGIVGKASSRAALNWTCPVNELDKHSDVWYRYLNSLYCELSTHLSQLKKKSYNVANIEDWANIHYPNLFNPKKPIYTPEEWRNNYGEGILINERNIGTFLERTGIFGIAEQDDIKKMELTDEQFIELNHVLELTIKDKLEISCVEPYMYVMGNNVLFSHINLSISAGTVDDSCQDLLDTDRLKYMNIFALNTVFIDDDIQKKFDLITVIAPKWEIIGTREMDLNGKDAKSEGTVGATDLETTSNTRAKDGKSGNPGEPGRNFFGIGEIFISGENLNISANGGDGSPGEDGKNGESGTDGVTPTTPSSLSCETFLCDNGRKINSFKCEKRSKCTPESYGYDVKLDCIYRIHGDKGTPGRNAGNGGNGGEGGSPGDIVLLKLDGHSGIKQSNNTGSNGLNGKGGVGGLGGKTGSSIDVKCKYRGLISGSSWEMLLTLPSTERAPSGRDGMDGRTLQTPRLTPIPNLHKAKIINRYKTFLRANINDLFRNYFLVNFLNRLENNPDVKSVYDILGFIDELKSLEDQVQTLYVSVDFLPFYKSLLNRISEYALSVKNRDDKKVLAYLYTATLGRVHNLEDDLESSLISDITKYLTIVKDDIKKLKEWQKSKVREEITNKYKKEYKTEIDKKINDANELISKEIIPEIHNIETSIDKSIDGLMNEVIKLQKETRVDHEKLLQKKQQLQNQLILQGIFGSLKILGTIVSFMGPVGAVAGGAINLGTGVAETALLDTSDNLGKNLKQTSTDLASLKKKIDEFGNQKAKELKNKVETVSDEVEKNSDVLGDISVKVRGIKARLTTIEQDKITIKEVQGLEIDLTTTLQQKKEELKAIEGKEGSDEQKTKKGIDVIGHLEKVLKVASVTADTFNKYKKSQDKITEIDKTIQQNEEKFDKLKQYENNIYNTMVPMLENMEKDLDNTINTIKNESRVALDVTRWKVKTTLKDMMLHLQRVTKDFQVQDSLVRCMDKLQDAMNTLINVQDYIQDYQSDQTLANFIAGVSSISVNDFDVSYNLMNRDDLRDALRDLEIRITSSVVMRRYRVAIDAFKQFVFPFADKYFGDSSLPSHLQSDTNKLDDEIDRAVDLIEQVNSKLEEYKATIDKIDQCSATGEFNSKSSSTKPFFKWKKNKYGDMISRLLSGEEVILSADVMRTKFVDMFDAIKFNSIEFGFKSKDKKLLSQMNKVLKSFKVTGTHLGNSHYRFQNDTYLINTADLTIWYSFDKNKDGQPYHKNDAYDKMQKGDFLLSPYASWKIKLSHLNMGNKFSFKDLEKYKNQVDFQLEGKGHYIQRGEQNCLDHEVNNYYTPIGDTGESNAVGIVPSVSYYTRNTRSRREINPENVNPVSQERWNTDNNYVHLDY